MEETKDSFTVGTPATGGCMKVYFDILKDSEEDILKKVNYAINIVTQAKDYKKLVSYLKK